MEEEREGGRRCREEGVMQREKAVADRGKGVELPMVKRNKIHGVKKWRKKTEKEGEGEEMEETEKVRKPEGVEEMHVEGIVGNGESSGENISKNNREAEGRERVALFKKLGV